MNLKMFFGTMLTLLGIVSITYTAIVFSGASVETKNMQLLVLYALLGMYFVTSGISLVRTTRTDF